MSVQGAALGWGLLGRVAGGEGREVQRRARVQRRAAAGAGPGRLGLTASPSALVWAGAGRQWWRARPAAAAPRLAEAERGQGRLGGQGA